MGIRQFIKSESAGGILLAGAALLALVVSNSPLAAWYEAFVHLPGEVRIGEDWLVLSKPLVTWVNDLWMAVFFFLVGLEIKRELVDGELASLKQAILPAGAALGGMVMPALIYVAINYGDAIALRGWAIPAATDIAFALAILMLLGSRVPASLKLFLTAVAIIDDLGAIVVIALFYTDNLSVPMLISSGIGCAALLLLNRTRVHEHIAVSGGRGTDLGLCTEIRRTCHAGRSHHRAGDTGLPSGWQFAAAGSRACAAAMGRLCNPADVCLRQCRRIAAGRVAGTLIATGTARYRSRV